MVLAGGACSAAPVAQFADSLLACAASREFFNVRIALKEEKTFYSEISTVVRKGY